MGGIKIPHNYYQKKLSKMRNVFIFISLVSFFIGFMIKEFL